MPGAFKHIEECLRVPERRTHARQPVRTISYVELDEGNGGIVLNASEGGLSVQAVMSLMEDSLPKMRFQLAQSNGWLETSARVAWTNESRKVAGLEFVDLPPQTRLHIRQWLAGDLVGVEPSGEHPKPEAAEVATDPSALAAIDDLSAPVLEPTLAEPAWPALLAETPAHRAAGPAPVFGSAPAFIKAPRALEATSERSHSDYAWNIVGLIALLAILGMAGWLTGSGTIKNLWRNLGITVPPTTAPPATLAPPVSTAAVPPISQLESVDIHDRSWMVPFSLDATNYHPNSQAQQQVQSEQWPTYNPAAAGPEIQTRVSPDDGAPQQPSPPTVPQSTAADALLPAQSAPVELKPPTPKAETEAAQPAGVFQRGLLVYHVDPMYPELAREQGVQGTVKLQVTISDTGVVRSVVAVSGPGLLIEAARDAVRQWRFTPSLLSGKPVESQEYVSILFQLPPSK